MNKKVTLTPHGALFKKFLGEKDVAHHGYCKTVRETGGNTDDDCTAD